MKLKAYTIILHLRLPAPTSFSLSCCYFRPVSALSLTTAGSTDLHPAPPRMRNISLNLLFSHRRKYQEVNDCSTPRQQICQKDWRSNWLSERACFEVTTCSTQRTRAGLVCTGSLSWQALFVPVEEFLCEQRMRTHLRNDLILQKMLLVTVHSAEGFSSEGNVAEPLCWSPCSTCNVFLILACLHYHFLIKIPNQSLQAQSFINWQLIDTCLDICCFS